jgi:molybdopterin-guanine dinucleotide biosynthesis protein A
VSAPQGSGAVSAAGGPGAGSGAHVLGAISAGGACTRFGSPKALAHVGGHRVIDRVAAALGTVVGSDRVIAIINDEALAAQAGLPHRADTLRDAGAVAGVHAALLWARQRGAVGALVVGCDMPFIEPALLRALLDRAADCDAVLPESDGRRGVEPLCAFYSVACIPAIEAAVARGDRRMIGFHADIAVQRLALDTVRTFGDPSRLFLNLNTPEDLATAERLAQ